LPDSTTETSSARPSFFRRCAGFARESSLALALAVAVGYALAVWLGEKILVNGGLGHDGRQYGRWAADFYGSVVKHGVSAYYIQRVLPSAVVHAGLRLVGAAPTTRNIIAGFEIANCVLVWLAAWSFSATVKQLGVSPVTRWLGALCLFGSFGILKWSAYYPVITDVWAMALGTFQLQCYLRRRPFALAAVTVLGAFAWPTLLLVGSCLLLCCGVERRAGPPSEAVPAHLHDVGAALATLAWGFACWSMLDRHYDPHIGTGPIFLPVVRLSWLVSAAFLFWGLRTLLRDRRVFDVRLILRGLLTVPGALAVALFVGLTLLRPHLSSGAHGLSVADHVDVTAFTALKAPGIFLLAHVLFFGPIVLVVCLRWSDLVRVLHGAGLGPTLIALLAVLFALNSESRKLFNFAPMVLPFVAVLLDRLQPPRRELAVFAIVSLLSSKVWLTLDGRLRGPASDFPSQTLYLSVGPWMSLTMYALQLVVVAVVAVWIARWLPRSPTS
jgi:hypothetical protein